MKYWNIYQSLLRDLEGGNYEPVSKILHAWREQLEQKYDLQLEWLRRLLAVRLSIKLDSKNLSDDVFQGNLEKLPPEIRAEIYFVRGLAHYERAEYLLGVRDFEQAKLLYADLADPYRELLSDYNAIAGSENAGLIDTNAEIAALSSLAFKANRFGLNDKRCQKFSAMAERNKSFLCQNQGKLELALECIEKALKGFDEIGPLSDLHICLLQKADVLVDLGQVDAAKLCVESVTDPIDSRVKFPLAFIRWRLGLASEPSIKDFNIVPNWRKKWDRLQQKNLKSDDIAWDRKIGELKLEDQKYILKVDSLEGRLVSVLAEGNKSKEMLCNSLWPENAATMHVENRLHRLISRVNKKIPKLVVLNSGRYTLAKR